MPRMLATSSVASAGMRRVAARSSAELYEPRRRLPEIPNTLVMSSPWIPRQPALRAPGLQHAARCALLLELRRDAAVGLAERQALAHHQAVGFLGGVDPWIEPYGVAPERERRDRVRQNGEAVGDQVDGTEQRELDELQVALVAGGQLGAHGERLGEAGLGGGGARAQQLEQVGVALLRHDRGAGGEGFGERHEPELGRCEQQYVGG